MAKQDIRSRSDVENLVNSFYAKVRKHEVIGPFFNESIKNWPEHLSKLADFWETNVFFAQRYKGNPMKAHIDVDQQFDNKVEQAHFGHWLELWFTTVDELYEGDNAELVKNRARNMAHMLFLRIFQHRKTDSTDSLQIQSAHQSR